MRRDIRRKATLAALGILLVAVFVMAAGPAVAKKPVKPPPEPPPPVDGGTIYFSQGGALHRMDPDGSDVVALSTAILQDAEPSALTHGGRWFLQVQELANGTYPDDRPRLELFAVHESGSPAIQLTDGQITATTFVEPNNALTAPIEVQSRWTDDDTTVSYMGLRTSYDAEGTRTIVDGGVYTLAVNPDALSSHSATAMSGPAALALVPIPNGIPAILNRHYDWRPDGGAIVFHTVPADTVGRMGVWVALASNGFSTPSLLADNGAQLQWSPDGSRILYQYGGLYSVAADGTEDPVLLVEDPEDSRKSLVKVNWPCWSPSSTHIAYTYYKYTIRDGSADYDVVRATDEGDDRAELSSGSLPRWRE